MNIRTTKDAVELLEQIDLLKESLFHTDLSSFSSILEGNNTLSSFVSKDSLSGSRESKLKYLDSLKNEISQLPRVTLTLAAMPDSSFLDILCNWFKVNTGKFYLLDISLKPSILGGVLISYNGLYRDYSLKSRIDTYFNQFSTIYELLRS